MKNDPCGQFTQESFNKNYPDYDSVNETKSIILRKQCNSKGFNKKVMVSMLGA